MFNTITYRIVVPSPCTLLPLLHCSNPTLLQTVSGSTTICIHSAVNTNPSPVTAGSSRKRGTKKPKNPNWRRQFRSNLTKLVAFYSTVKLQPCHLELLNALTAKRFSSCLAFMYLVTSVLLLCLSLHTQVLCTQFAV